MENIQNYLKRLVINEGNFAEQVEDKKERYDLTERIENIENEAVRAQTGPIHYEDAAAFDQELQEGVYKNE